jgi:hypothetical protein
MYKNVVKFWTDSYQTDKIAFYFELVSFVFTVGASLTLALNAANPNMLLVYPGFLVGSATQAYASYRRGLPWILLLTSYFVCVNILGFGVAAQWW